VETLREERSLSLLLLLTSLDGLAQAKPRPLPAPHGRRVASFSPQQLAQLSDALEAATKIELKVRPLPASSSRVFAFQPVWA